MSLRAHLLGLAILVTGCENDILLPTAISAPSPPTAVPPSLNARDTNALGSYEIVFDTVTPDDRFSPASAPLPITPVSIGQRARLDVRASQQPGFIEVSITPRWGARHVYNHSPAVGGALAVGQRGNAITFA